MVLGTQVPAGGLGTPWWSAAAWSVVVKEALMLSTRGVSVWSLCLDSWLETWKLQTGFPQFSINVFGSAEEKLALVAFKSPGSLPSSESTSPGEWG